MKKLFYNLFIVLAGIHGELVFAQGIHNDANTLGFWKFDEASGQQCIDSSGHQHAQTNLPGPGIVQGRYGNTRHLDGVTVQDISIPYNATYHAIGGTDFTLEFWLKFDDVTQQSPLVFQRLNGQSNTWLLEYVGSANEIRFSNFGAAFLTKSWAPANNIWHHLAVTRNITLQTYTLYIDGDSATSVVAGNLATSIDLFTLGYNNFGAGQLFHGYIDEFRISNIVRSPSEFNLKPTTPTNLNITGVSSNQINIAWNACTGGQTKYRIYRSIGGPSSFALIDSVNSTTTSYDNTGLTNSTAYYYEVTAVNEFGETVRSNRINATTFASEPTASPTSMVFLSRTENTLSVNFTAASPIASGYIALRNSVTPTYGLSDGATYSQGSTLPNGDVVAYVGSGTAFNETGLTHNSKYVYKILSYNGSGSTINYRSTSPLLDSTSTLAINPISQPTNLNLTPGISTISWTFNAGSGSSGYIVIRKTGSQPTSDPIDGTVYMRGKSLGTGNVAYVGTSLSYTDSGLTAGTPYYYKVYSFNGTDTSINYLTSIAPLSNSTITQIDGEAPVITSTISNPSLPNPGNAVTITATVMDNSGIVNSVQIRYKKGNQSFGSFSDMAKTGNSYSKIIPTADITILGVIYEIRVIDASNNRDSVTKSLVIAIPAQSFSTTSIQDNPYFTAGINSSTKGNKDRGWNMISIPFDLDDKKVSNVFQSLGGTYGTDWVVYKDQQKLSATSTLVLGSAYWLKQLSGTAKHLELGAGKLSDPDSVKFTLNGTTVNDGWNQIGNPYPFNIAWTPHANIQGPFTRNAADNGYDSVSTLRPFQGYWVRNKTLDNIEIRFKPTGISFSKYAQITKRNDGWSLPFDISSDGLTDHVELGVASDAQNNNNQYNQSPIPVIGDYIQGYVAQSGEQYAVNYRTSGDDGYVWDLYIRSNMDNKPGTVSWNTVEIPRSYVVAVYDVTHNNLIENNYSFRNQSEDYPIHLKVIAGFPTFVNQVIFETKRAFPKSFALSQNFPNPFNPSSTIRYDLAHSSYVSLRIYNLLGQEVRTLVSGVKETGSYEAVWDARNNQGESVASGIYIYRLQTDAFVKSKKMLLIK